MKSRISAILAIGFMLIPAVVMAGKPSPVPTVSDYDLVGVNCPAELPVGVPLVVDVNVVNRGSDDPGAVLRINSETCCGGIILVDDVVYDEVESGNTQKSTTYSYTLDSYPEISIGAWVYLEMYIWDVDPDYDLATCMFQIVP